MCEEHLDLYFFHAFTSPQALKVCKTNVKSTPPIHHHFLKSPAGAEGGRSLFLFPVMLSHKSLCVRSWLYNIPRKSSHSRPDDLHAQGQNALKTNECTQKNSHVWIQCTHKYFLLGYRQVPVGGERSAFVNRLASGEPRKFHTESLSSSETTSGL